MKVVFVLMVYAAGAYWQPTIEFTDAGKCATAAIAMDAQIAARPSFGRLASPSWCARIEK